MRDTTSIDKYIAEHMSEKRRIHTEGVRSTAIALAKKWGADPVKADLAARYHDIYRGVPVEELNRMVLDLGLDTSRYLDNANLAHGKIAAAMLPQLFSETDPDIIAAVSYHTTGRSGMSVLEKVLFMADAIEPNRDYPNVDTLRRITERDLDEGCLAALCSTCKHVLELELPLDPDSIEAVAYFKELVEKKSDGN